MVRRQLEPTSIIRVASITTLAGLAPTRTTLRSRKHRQTGGESTTALVATWTVYFPIYLGSNVGNEYAFLAPNKKSALERSEERSVGKEGVGMCISRGSRCP